MAALRYAAASLGSSHGRRFHRQFMRTRRLIRRERDQRLRAEPTRASSPDAAQTDPSSDRSPQSCHRPYMPGPFNKPRAKHACAPPPSRGTASGTPYVVIFPRAHPAQHNQEHRIRQGRCLGWRLGMPWDPPSVKRYGTPRSRRSGARVARGAHGRSSSGCRGIVQVSG